MFMGMRPSPYIAVRHYYWAEEFAKGDPMQVGNPIGFNKVILNLPGMTTYNPTLPEVFKWNTTAKVIAGDVITFIDDMRVSGYLKENCRTVHLQFASRIQFLGIRMPCESTGPHLRPKRERGQVPSSGLVGTPYQSRWLRKSGRKDEP